MAHERLGSIGEHVVAPPLACRVGPSPHTQRGPEVDRARPRRERPGADQERTQERELLLRRGEALHQELPHEQAEHRIPEELEALVVGAAASLLVGIARVRERLVEVEELALDLEAIEQRERPRPRWRSRRASAHRKRNGTAEGLGG